MRPEIGGKAYSRFYIGVWNEFGNVFFFTDIYDQTTKLIEQYTPNFLYPINVHNIFKRLMKKIRNGGNSNFKLLHLFVVILIIKM